MNEAMSLPNIDEVKSHKKATNPRRLSVFSLHKRFNSKQNVNEEEEVKNEAEEIHVEVLQPAEDRLEEWVFEALAEQFVEGMLGLYDDTFKTIKAEKAAVSDSTGAFVFFGKGLSHCQVVREQMVCDQYFLRSDIDMELDEELDSSAAAHLKDISVFYIPV